MRALKRRILSKDEQLALNKEVYRQLMERADENALYYDAVVLMTLYKFYGFRKRRLRKFFEQYQTVENELHEWYKVSLASADTREDAKFYALEELKRCGVDLRKWRELKSNWKPEKDEVWSRG